MTYSYLFHQAKNRIQSTSLEYGDLDSHVFKLFEGVLEMPKKDVLLNWNHEVADNSVEKVQTTLQKRLQGMPLQYLVGHEYFYNLKFSVGPGVLIPRPETESLVEYVLSHFGKESLKIAELGSGSGNIAISILKERPLWQWHGFELNPSSVKYLESNLKDHFICNFKLHCGNFFELVENESEYDLVISNPPYIETKTIETLSQEVQKEPLLALDGGETGLDCIEKLIAKSKSILKKEGVLIFEIDPSQGQVCRDLLMKNSFATSVVFKDYSGQDRFVVGRK